jgi:hypothetical protein
MDHIAYELRFTEAARDIVVVASVPKQDCLASVILGYVDELEFGGVFHILADVEITISDMRDIVEYMENRK